jgi:hypothetical protein
MSAPLDTQPYCNGLLLPRGWSASDPTKARRLDEAKRVGWDRHAYVVPAARQLHSDGSARFDIAATSVGCHHKFHWRNLTVRRGPSCSDPVETRRDESAPTWLASILSAICPSPISQSAGVRQWSVFGSGMPSLVENSASLWVESPSDTRVRGKKTSVR